VTCIAYFGAGCIVLTSNRCAVPRWLPEQLFARLTMHVSLITSKCNIDKVATDVGNRTTASSQGGLPHM